MSNYTSPTLLSSKETRESEIIFREGELKKREGVLGKTSATFAQLFFKLLKFLLKSWVKHQEELSRKTICIDQQKK